MCNHAVEPEQASAPAARYARIELTVRNHPGVMSHVCGLFSRRACNVEGILCMPTGDGQESRIWLLLNDDQRLGQVLKQVRKLEDVIEVHRRGIEPADFRRLEDFFEQGRTS